MLPEVLPDVLPDEPDVLPEDPDVLPEVPPDVLPDVPPPMPDVPPDEPSSTNLYSLFLTSVCSLIQTYAFFCWSSFLKIDSYVAEAEGTVKLPDG